MSEIREDMAYHAKSLEKLIEARTADNRAFTADERKEAAEHEAAIEACERELKEINDTEATEARIKGKLDAVRKPAARQVPAMQSADDDHSFTAKKIETKGYVPHNMRCFKDSGQGSAKAAEDAYKCGVWLANKFWKTDWAKARTRELMANDRAHNENNNNEGGAFVPDQYANYLIRNVEEYGVWLKESLVVPMTSDHMIVPRRVSGLTTYNVAEGVAATESTAATDNITLTAKKLGVLARWSSELNEDAAVSVADFIMSEMALAAAAKLDKVGFMGDATNADFNIRGLVPAIEAMANTSWSWYREVPINTFAEFTSDALGAVQGRVAGYAWPNGKWYGSPSAIFAGIGGVLQGMGGVTISEAASTIPLRYNGYPCVIAHHLREQSSGSVSDNLAMVLFGDLKKAATTGLRRQFEIATSAERYFLEDQVALRGTLRFDINIHDLGGAESGGHTTKGPICALIADAS